VTVSEVSRQDAQDIARLARLELSSAELDEMCAHLSSVLQLFAVLQRIDVGDAAPMTHATEISLPRCPDQPTPSLPTEVIVAAAPAHRDGLFVVPAMIPGGHE
jgi:aspartyl-tRNA(Asn)/glutamyl-tRNA(Gln) amidotransferase subunit C